MNKNNQFKYKIMGIISITFLLLVLVINIYFFELPFVVITAGLLGVLIFYFWKRTLPQIFLILFPLMVVIYMLGSEHILDLYVNSSYYDKVAHFFTEFVLTLLVGYSLKPVLEKKIHPLLFVLIISSIGIMLGVLWEIIEWGLYFYMPVPSGYTAMDTATDLIADSLGAVLAALLIRKSDK